MYPDNDSYWAFKRRFTSQLGIMDFASYVLVLSKGAPFTFRFVLGTGDILPWEIAPR